MTYRSTVKNGCQSGFCAVFVVAVAVTHAFLLAEGGVLEGGVVALFALYLERADVV